MGPALERALLASRTTAGTIIGIGTGSGMTGVGQSEAIGNAVPANSIAGIGTAITNAAATIQRQGGTAIATGRTADVAIVTCAAVGMATSTAAATTAATRAASRGRETVIAASPHGADPQCRKGKEQRLRGGTPLRGTTAVVLAAIGRTARRPFEIDGKKIHPKSQGRAPGMWLFNHCIELDYQP